MDIFNTKPLYALSIEPPEGDAFNSWLEQTDVIPFLESDILDDDIIIYAALPHAFIHAVFIPKTEINPPMVADLSKWNGNPYSGWGMSCTHDDAWMESPLASFGSKILENGEQILFGREFEGDDSKSSYFEVEQKITHVLGLHFMLERNAWCKLDQHGDIDEVIKIVDLKTESGKYHGRVISARRTILGEYSCLRDFLLIRMFDFTRFRMGSFSGWDNRTDPTIFGDGVSIFGNLVVAKGNGSFSRGFQVADIMASKVHLVNRVWGREVPGEEKKYASFIAHDWKNKRIAEISCDPKCLANYFTESELPFEVTPTFFRPEVLLKYKADKSKYKLEERSISCRGSWHLKTFDVNEAGQVHTYLIYLSHLPYEEQLHWKQFNERPKAPLSKRAITTDFEGQFSEEYDPLHSLKYKFEELKMHNVEWWKLRDENAFSKVHYPFTASPDEWADEIMNLDQLIVEGFAEKWLRQKAAELGRKPDPKFRALKLIEECLIGFGYEVDHAHSILSPFHLVHNLRSKIKGHASGDEAASLKKEALKSHGTFHKHFVSVCTGCDESLEILIHAFKNQPNP